MEKYSGYTATEILKVINDFEKEHESLKQEVILYIEEIQALDKIIDEKKEIIEEIEMKYVQLMEILIEKQKNGK